MAYDLKKQACNIYMNSIYNRKLRVVCPLPPPPKKKKENGRHMWTAPPSHVASCRLRGCKISMTFTKIGHDSKERSERFCTPTYAQTNNIVLKSVQKKYLILHASDIYTFKEKNVF